MVRDIETIREILLAIEGSANNLASGELVPERDRAEVLYNLELLIGAGFVEGIDASSLEGPRFLDLRLTWYGHDFLENVRDQGVWKNVRARLAEVGGSASLDVVSDLAKSVVRSTLGI